MKIKKLAIGVWILLLVAGAVGVSASAPAVYGPRPSSPAGYVNRPDGARAHAVQAAGWQQVDENGFGDPDASEVSALAEFNGYLYAGTTNPADGARIFRSADGLAWTPVTLPGFGNAHDTRPPAILDLAVFKGRVYAGTGLGDGPGQIWRALDGVNWAPMTMTGFSNPDTVDFTVLAEFNSYIYVGATNLESGAMIWRSQFGTNNTWTQVAPAGLHTALARVTGMAVFDGALYAALDSEFVSQIWRSTSGSAWTAVGSNGFGDPLTKSTGGLAEFGGYLYAGAGNDDDGAQLWRTNNGTSWEQVIEPGFGDPHNQKVEQVFVFQNQLYASTRNTHTGMELWRSADGATWEQANADGFGDPDNTGSIYGNAVAEFLGDLYVGTSNLLDGGELWRLEGQGPPPPAQLYLPAVLRWP